MNQQNSKQNVLAIRHIFDELFTKGNHNACEQFIAEDIKIHLPASWQAFHSPELYGRSHADEIQRHYTNAFQFTDVVVGDLITNNDQIYVRWECEGVHNGDFFDICASYREFSIGGQTVYKFNQENQIEEIWQSWDMLGLLKQIGTVQFNKTSPAPPIVDQNLKKALLLSPRERECVRLLLQGKTAQETADDLMLSRRTVEYYFENIKNKLTCLNKRELFVFARLLEEHNLL